MFCYLGASVSGVIDAPIEAVWELVSDPTRHPQLAGSGEVQAVTLAEAEPMGPGAIFQSQQEMRGLRYVTANRTVIWEPPFRFAWRVGVGFAPGVAQIWMFSLTPEAGGTRVENAVLLPYALPTFFPFRLAHDEVGQREIGVMRPTLDNLAHALGVMVPTAISASERAPAALAALMPSPLLQGALWAGGVAALLYALERWRRR
jgi:uncharacterized protein YndB with AHSA1/START domain